MNKDRFNKLINKIGYDKYALEEIYECYYDKAVHYLTYYFDDNCAKDSVQEFFIQLVEKNKQYEYIEYPTAWVYKCVENIAKKHFKSDVKNLEYNDALCGELFLDIGTKDDEFERMISLLSDIDKKIFRMYFVFGYTLVEISKTIGLSYGTTKQRYRRALKKLKKNTYYN